MDADIDLLKQVMARLPLELVKETYERVRDYWEDGILAEANRWLLKKYNIELIQFHAHTVPGSNIRNCKDCPGPCMTFKFAEIAEIVIYINDLDRYVYSIHFDLPINRKYYKQNAYGIGISRQINFHGPIDPEKIIITHLTRKDIIEEYLAQENAKSHTDFIQKGIDFCQYLLGDVSNIKTYGDFAKTHVNSPIMKIYKHLVSLSKDRLVNPAYYVKKTVVTFLALRHFRRALTSLPKEMVRLIAINMYDTRDPIWENKK